MITFYPGPSKVFKEVPQYVQEAYNQGILSINHRSEAFISLCSATQKILRANLNIPADYMIFFTSSATESWEIIAQSLPNTMSYHFYNGAFGEKWFRYTKKIKKKVIGYQFDFTKALKPEIFDLSGEKGIICITQNETSNGTRVATSIIKKLHESYPDHLLAVDVTSSLGGINLPFEKGDIWYASVQKCLGLPAGLGLLICSPKAVKAFLEQKENNHYNSLIFMREMMKDYQTPYTPNVLGIYLLKRTQEATKTIGQIEAKIQKRAKKYYKLLDTLSYVKPLINKPSVRSDTVVVCEMDKARLKEIKDKATDEGIILGNGYGEWKDTTFRIANFPALKGKEVKKLRKFLKSFS